ncbi:hypothetical protein QJS10_CPB11g01984 [Acorus calamus]|uniref:Uncharacterized protein n=1 Tax=Acorus calamus TaxID=4465 RepID=A0AAV9DSR8_ACOCL|nr:hypothetical protein QJS10_CPB11g01984 [Acorus calamus]
MAKAAEQTRAVSPSPPPAFSDSLALERTPDVSVTTEVKTKGGNEEEEEENLSRPVREGESSPSDRHGSFTFDTKTSVLCQVT